MKDKPIQKIVFITGTRADYGKLKSLIKEAEKVFDVYVFVCGMHLMNQYGATYKEILLDDYKNIHCAQDISYSGNMDLDLASVIASLHQYLKSTSPDLIVVHGDRIEALAGAISGMLNNIRIAHIEGGEVTGTVDESIRHSISKMAQYHFVANYESKLRLVQLGELESSIYVIGSPDIDIMLSSQLPSLEHVKKQQGIHFDNYAIFIYHPVTTEVDQLSTQVKEVFNAIKQSEKNYIIIYPNNDLGSQIIIDEIENISHDDKFLSFQSLPFEHFLTVLKHADFIIGNSSAGIREACVYGVPAIDIGSRQNGRYKVEYLRNVQHVEVKGLKILECIKQIHDKRSTSHYFGEGKSATLFIEAINSRNAISIQKKFIDTCETQEAIQNYINEVCF